MVRADRQTGDLEVGITYLRVEGGNGASRRAPIVVDHPLIPITVVVKLGKEGVNVQVGGVRQPVIYAAADSKTLSIIQVLTDRHRGKEGGEGGSGQDGRHRFDIIDPATVVIV